MLCWVWDGSLNKPDVVPPARSGPHNQRAVSKLGSQAGEGQGSPALGPRLPSTYTEVRGGVLKEVGCGL